MADENKPQLSDEELIEKKAKMFRTISRILIVVAVIVIGVFAYFAMGTKENIDQQTEIYSQEMRSKLKQIINLEKRYHRENGEYVSFKYLSLCKELGNYNPAVDGDFKYKFDAETGIATGMEKNDVNMDNDLSDGLTLSVNWEAGETDGSSFFWTDSELADFEKRKAE